MSAAARPEGDRYRFYVRADQHPGYLIRMGIGDGSLHGPEHWVAGAWASAPRSVIAAIFGLGDDVWSGPSWYADPLTPDEARSYAAEHGIDLFAESPDP